MALVFVPTSASMPLDPDEFPATWWYALWDAPVPRHLLPAEGGTVFLAGPDGVVRWETEVASVVVVPYEHPDAFLAHATRRFGTPAGPVVGTAPVPGFALAWSARPVRELSVDAGALGVRMTGWSDTDALDPALARALGVPHPAA